MYTYSYAWLVFILRERGLGGGKLRCMLGRVKIENEGDEEMRGF